MRERDLYVYLHDTHAINSDSPGQRGGERRHRRQEMEREGLFLFYLFPIFSTMPFWNSQMHTHENKNKKKPNPICGTESHLTAYWGGKKHINSHNSCHKPHTGVNNHSVPLLPYKHIGPFLGITIFFLKSIHFKMSSTQLQLVMSNKTGGTCRGFLVQYCMHNILSF